jgi:hypothetical protein
MNKLEEMGAADNTIVVHFICLGGVSLCHRADVLCGRWLYRQANHTNGRSRSGQSSLFLAFAADARAISSSRSSIEVQSSFSRPHARAKAKYSRATAPNDKGEPISAPRARARPMSFSPMRRGKSGEMSPARTFFG